MTKLTKISQECLATKRMKSSGNLRTSMSSTLMSNSKLMKTSYPTKNSAHSLFRAHSQKASLTRLPFSTHIQMLNSNLPVAKSFSMLPSGSVNLRITVSPQHTATTHAVNGDKRSQILSLLSTAILSTSLHSSAKVKTLP